MNEPPGGGGMTRAAAGGGTAPSLDVLDGHGAEAIRNLSGADRRIATAIYRLLATGAPASVADVAQHAGVAPSRVRTNLEAWPGVFRDQDGGVIGFWGLAIPRMPHRIRFHGAGTLSAWCAWDPLFLCRIIGAATVETRDPLSGAAIRYEFGPDGGRGPLGEHVLSFVDPTVVGDDIISTFCHYIRHFTNRANGQRWVDDHPGTFLLSFRDAAELGRRHARRLLGEDRFDRPSPSE